MKIYIAARAKTRTDEVKQIQDKLRKMGHIIVYDWAVADVNIKRPYRDPLNRKHNTPAQAKMLKVVSEAEVFILLDEPGLRGAYIELGVFLRQCLDDPARRVYIVGPESHLRESVFESPDYVFFADTIEEVYAGLTTPASASTVTN
jgi:hypothetical protein